MKIFTAIFGRIYAIIFGKIRYAKKLGVKIGDNCRIYIRDWGSEPFLISIGNNVTIAANTRIINHDGSLWLFRTKEGRYFNYDTVSIDNNVFIGMNCIILPGVHIGQNVIVGAGSVVTKSLEPNWVYAGNPAKKIKPIQEFKENMEANSVHSRSGDFDNYQDRVLECVRLKK